MFWVSAEEYLKHNGPWPITETDLTRYEEPELNATLNEAQKNALHVFRCVRRIQKLLYKSTPIFKEEGRIEFDPISVIEKEQQLKLPEMSNAGPELPPLNRMKNVTSDFALQVMHLTLAAVKCDFYDKVWSHAKGGMAEKDRLQKRSITNKEIAQADYKKILRLAGKYKKKSIKGTIEAVRRHWQGSPLPSYGKCQPIVRDFFRVKTK